MNRKIIIFTTILVLSVFSSAQAIPLVQDIVGGISQASYSNYLNNMLYTHLGDNRGFGTEHNLARANIFSEFESFGLDTYLHPFTYSDETYYNVVATHYGTVYPDEIYIVGAHYDSVSNPGADDNASGTAGVLEAARILSQYEFERTLVFIGFDREEQGLRGSRAYAQEHTNDNILGMISMDMIAYNGSGANRVTIGGQTTSLPIKEALADAVTLYGDGISPEIYGPLNGSDHYPFETEGFQACLLIEYNYWENPNYHQLTDSVDTPDYIDYGYATNTVRAAAGFLASVAIPIPEPGTVTLFSLGFLVLLKKHRA